MYCNSGAMVVACRTCRLRAQLSGLVTTDLDDPSSTVTRVTGSLGLEMQFRVRLLGGAVSAERSSNLTQAWCVYPACLYIPLWGLGNLQVGVRFGMELVAGAEFAGTGDIDVNVTGYELQLAGDSGTGENGRPSLSVSTRKNASSTVTHATPVTGQLGVSLGFKPLVQVGAWGNVSTCAFSCSLLPASAAMAVYAQARARARLPREASPLAAPPPPPAPSAACPPTAGGCCCSCW